MCSIGLLKVSSFALLIKLISLFFLSLIAVLSFFFLLSQCLKIILKVLFKL